MPNLLDAARALCYSFACNPAAFPLESQDT